MISIRRFAFPALAGLALLVQACDGGPTGPKTGSLTVNIANLPADVAGAVTVQGAVGTPPLTVTSTRTIPDLTPGTYTITAAKAVGAKASYTPAIASQIAEVVASTTPATVNVGYTLSTGIAAVTITGLPAGTDASVTLYNTAGFFANVKTSGEVGNLEPGPYTMQVAPVSSDEVYSGTEIQTQFTVTASPTPVALQATYTATTGSIAFSATGLPPGAVPVWDVSGPNSFVFLVRASDGLILPRLAPGTYTVTARTFDFAQETWGSAPNQQSITVTAGVKAPAAFVYVTRPPTLNLSVEGAYITQSSQRFNGSVPLIADRPAFLRAFVKANEPNSAAPKVRARFYRNGTLVTTGTMDPPAQSVGTSVTERDVSWGMVVPAGVVSGGLSIVIDVDPDNNVREVSEGDNVFPANGAPLAVAVRSVPPLEVRFVPIETAANSLVGNVSESRAPDLISQTLRMFPIATSSVDVRATFTTSAPLLTPNDGAPWIQIINELNALRIAEGTQRHYVGILKAPYTGGIAGLGFVPGKTTLSWDASSAGSTVAHELGHNFGRNHAPCGGPAGVDQSYPYPNARIGVFGFDVANRLIMDSERRDVMSYCGPEWVSDYTYEGILNYRGSVAADVSGSVQSTLLLWGRVDDGQKLVLEPAFMADTRPSLPKRDGKYRVEGFDAAGAMVFSLSFDPERLGDDRIDSRQFGFAVPMSEATARRIVSLRLSGEGRETRSMMTATGSPVVAASTVSAEKVRVTWNSAQYPMLVVRDPDTREILAFARGGATDIRTRKRSLDVSASNRIGSSRLMVQVRN